MRSLHVMRSLKECYEVAKKYHTYWSDEPGNTRFMCLAAAIAYDRGELTPGELHAVRKDAMSLVGSFDKNEPSLWRSMGCPPDEEVKAYWDNYFSKMENQDG